MKKGRKAKHYVTTWGESINGLYRAPDGRWRIVSTDKMFRESDEHLAVTKFRQMTADLTHAIVLPSVTGNQFGEQIGHHVDGLQKAYVREAGTREGMPVVLESDALFSWIREALLTRPQWLASRVGIPQLAALQDLPLPRASIRLQTLIDLYEKHSQADKKTIRILIRVWKHFQKVTDANTLRDVTTEKFLAFRSAIMENGWTPRFVAKTFHRVKRVIREGLKHGLDAGEIRAALDRSAVLITPKFDAGGFNPKPIDTEDFHKLLRGATPELRACLLLSLNCCLYLDECLSVKWDDLDLKKGIYRTRRGKTKVFRVATLWDETIEAVKGLKEMPVYLFTSHHGTRFSTNSYRTKYNRLREAVKIDAQFNEIRDGAYTAAVEGQDQISAAKLLAGHRIGGETDAYVMRRPQAVKPACDAVYTVYAPFPPSAAAAVKIGRPRKTALPDLTLTA